MQPGKSHNFHLLLWEIACSNACHWKTISMAHRSREDSFSTPGQQRKLRFRGDLALQYGFAGMEGTAPASSGGGFNRVEDIIFQDEVDSRRSASRNGEIGGSTAGDGKGESRFSLMDVFFIFFFVHRAKRWILLVCFGLTSVWRTKGCSKI